MDTNNNKKINSAVSVRFGVITQVLIKIKMFLGVSPCRLVSGDVSKAQRSFETSVIIFMIRLMAGVHLIHVFSLIRCIFFN
jgi:hypothetical protein